MYAVFEILTQQNANKMVEYGLNLGDDEFLMWWDIHMEMFNRQLKIMDLKLWERGWGDNRF